MLGNWFKLLTQHFPNISGGPSMSETIFSLLAMYHLTLCKDSHSIQGWFSGKCPSCSCNYHFPPNDTVDGCEILHQLIGGKHPILHRVSTIQDGAGFLPPNDMLCHVSSIRWFQMTPSLILPTFPEVPPASIQQLGGSWCLGSWVLSRIFDGSTVKYWMMWLQFWDHFFSTDLVLMNQQNIHT